METVASKLPGMKYDEAFRLLAAELDAAKARIEELEKDTERKCRLTVMESVPGYKMESRPCSGEE